MSMFQKLLHMLPPPTYNPELVVPHQDNIAQIIPPSQSQPENEEDVQELLGQSSISNSQTSFYNGHDCDIAQNKKITF